MRLDLEKNITISVGKISVFAYSKLSIQAMKKFLGTTTAGTLPMPSSPSTAPGCACQNFSLQVLREEDTWLELLVSYWVLELRDPTST